MRCKALLIGMSLVVCLSAFYSESPAWEFSMEGSFSTTYEYYGQRGGQGFFGNHNVDNSSGTVLPVGSYSSLNAWVGDQVDNLVSGTEGARQYFNLDFAPEIRLNKAIRLRATYRLGDYGDPEASDYIANTRPGTDVATSDGQWTMWWVTAQTPVGIFVLGKRPQPFGTGLQYNGESNATTEGVALVSGYGPLRLSYGFRPFFPQPPNPRLAAGPPGGDEGFYGDFPYYNLFDRSGVRRLANRVFITYRQGPIDSGIFFAWLKWHAGPESQILQTDRVLFRTFDEDLRHASAYMKFNNGRFFFNTEVTFFERMTKRQGRVLNDSNAGPLYIESWRYMTELGAYWGPAKVSLLYSFLPGPDRRAGRRIDKQPFLNSPGFGTYDVHRPYSYLLGYAYGGGINAFNLNGNGYINDATVLAGRLDYAAAANLNLFGSFLWAHRNSHGYGWGFIRPGLEGEGIVEVDDDFNPGFGVELSPTIVYQPNGGPNPAPSIPDGDLGWEAQIGLDWQLLEQYTLHAAFSYWQPGKWFKYACIDRGVTNWDQPGPGNNWGINPARSIDAILGLEVSVSADF